MPGRHAGGRRQDPVAGWGEGDTAPAPIPVLGKLPGTGGKPRGAFLGPHPGQRHPNTAPEPALVAALSAGQGRGRQSGGERAAPRGASAGLCGPQWGTRVGVSTCTPPERLSLAPGTGAVIPAGFLLRASPWSRAPAHVCLCVLSWCWAGEGALSPTWAQRGPRPRTQAPWVPACAGG